MLSLRSLSTFVAFSACLAQVRAGPQYGGGGGGSGNGFQHQQGDGSSGVTITLTQTMMMTMMQTTTETLMMTMAAQAAATVTVTAVGPCSSVVTAYVNNCGSGSSMLNVPVDAGGSGLAPLTTISFQNFQQGLSSIPAAEAVLAGVTVAAAAPPAATVAASVMSTTITSVATSAAPAAVQQTAVAGSTFTTVGPIVEGLSSIPNTMLVSPAAAQVAPATLASSFDTSTLSYVNSGVLGVGAKRWVVVDPTPV